MRKSATQWLDDLRSPDKRISQRARLKLGGLGADDSSMAAELLAAVDEADDQRRFWSVVGLARLVEGKALGAKADDICRRMIALAQSDPEFGIRQGALTLLGRCPAQADVVVPAIVGVVRADGNAFVRAEAVRALTALGSAAAPAAGFLVSALDDLDSEVARYAAIALKFVPVSDPRLMDALRVASVGHQDAEVRSQLAAAVEIQDRGRAGRLEQ